MPIKITRLNQSYGASLIGGLGYFWGNDGFSWGKTLTPGGFFSAKKGGGSSQWIHGHKATDPNIAKGCRIKINRDRMGCVHYIYIYIRP